MHKHARTHTRTLTGRCTRTRIHTHTCTNKRSSWKMSCTYSLASWVIAYLWCTQYNNKDHYWPRRCYKLLLENKEINTVRLKTQLSLCKTKSKPCRCRGKVSPIYPPFSSVLSLLSVKYWTVSHCSYLCRSFYLTYLETYMQEQFEKIWSISNLMKMYCIVCWTEFIMRAKPFSKGALCCF